ncbi:hypothetical protein [Demequina sp. SO4-18]|uniref:hypothetical protein n=1 Tax=Demequina sp. SO4-18 TaxID=3401026 RepID=UPI003B5B639F
MRDDFGRRGRHIHGVRLHYSTDMMVSPAEQLVHPVARALDVAGRCLDPRAHLVAVDSALHQGLVRPDELAAFTVTSRERRNWLLAHADARSEAVGETLARLDVVERGLAVYPQRFVKGAGRIDLVVANSVAVEIDGRTFHDDPESFRRDRRRDRKVVVAGMPVLRFAHSELLGADAVHVGDAVLDLMRTMGD